MTRNASYSVYLAMLATDKCRRYLTTPYTVQIYQGIERTHTIPSVCLFVFFRRSRSRSRCRTPPGLEQVPEALLHPEGLVGAVHVLHAGGRGDDVRRRVPGLLAVLQPLVEVLQDPAEPQRPEDGDAKHRRDDAVALAEAVLLEDYRMGG